MLTNEVQGIFQSSDILPKALAIIGAIIFLSLLLYIIIQPLSGKKKITSSIQMHPAAASMQLDIPNFFIYICKIFIYLYKSAVIYEWPIPSFPASCGIAMLPDVGFCTRTERCEARHWPSLLFRHQAPFQCQYPHFFCQCRHPARGCVDAKFLSTPRRVSHRPMLGPASLPAPDARP